MRFITLLCCFFAASLVSAKDIKIATVDLQKLFKEYPGTAKAQKKFSAMAEKKKKELTESAEDLKDLEKELGGSSSVLSAKMRKQKEKEYQLKAREISQLQDQMRNDLASKENEMTQNILEELKGIVAAVAKDKGVDLVLDSEKTVYLSGGLDLTEAVLKSYKKVDADSSADTDSKKK